MPSTSRGTPPSNKKRKCYFEIFQRGKFQQSLLNDIVTTNKPLPDSKKTSSDLSRVSYLLRGFGRRHYIMLMEKMKSMRYLKPYIRESFCKFKVLQMIFPEQKSDLIWIFKNLLTLDGQRLYNDTFDASLDISYNRALWYFRYIDPPDVFIKRERLLKYFFKNDPSTWAPLRIFPPILFEKKRMDLSFVPLKNEYSIEEAREIFFKYIMKLNLKDLFIPPPDILYKVGNQFYNDEGVPKKDYEKPSSFKRSGFLYQYFLAGPLSPREVWLPDKFTKHNNLFWMTICRQFLKKSTVYPSHDPYEVWTNIRKKLEEGCLRFDISGFGFQFPRQLLSCMASVIQELYPCDHMDEQSNDLNSILSSVKVEVGFSVVYPPRGIGLGYYEDLKTLVMLALLDDFDPISVYGDQGILAPGTFEAILRLQKFDFLLKDDKVEYQSYDQNGGMKWAGHGMFPDELRRVKDLSNPLIGSLFGRTHWERKASLYSFAIEEPQFYQSIFKRLKKCYRQLYGDEFHNGELDLAYEEGGINIKAQITHGALKTHIVSRYLRPYEDTLFEVPYVTPFKKRDGKIYPTGIAKQFQKKRVDAYKRYKPIDSGVFFYGEPRLSYNSHYRPAERIIPDWADMLFLCEYGVTTGNFTYGLDRGKLIEIAEQHSLSSDPLRAAARGGFKVLDYDYSRNRPLSREWQVAVSFLQSLDLRRLPILPRVDLGTAPMIFNMDKMYFHDNLNREVVKTSLKRTRSQVSVSEYDDYSERITQRLKNFVESEIHSGLIASIGDIVTTGENMIDSEQDFAADYEDFDLYDQELLDTEIT